MFAIYHKHPKRGSGRRTIKITGEDGQVVELKTLKEQLLAAQIIQAQTFLGATRAEAEAAAAEEILARRKAWRWFGR